MNHHDDRRARYVPSPDDIRDACARIRDKRLQAKVRHGHDGRTDDDDDDLDRKESNAPPSPD